MRRRRETKVERGQDKPLTEETYDIAVEAAAVATDALQLAGLATRGLVLAKRSTGLAEEAVAIAKSLSDKLAAMPHGEVLTSDELTEFAQAFPQWSVSSGISDGRAYKSYRRTITARELPLERRAGGVREHETYLRLADPEYSDTGLAQIFGAYHIDGNHMNGQYYDISIQSDEAGPITYGDFNRVMQAEEYLLEQNYVRAPRVANPAA